MPNDPQWDERDEQADSPEEPETIVDISSGAPEIMDSADPEAGNFIFGQFGQARIFSTNASSRACLIPIALTLLLLCCACVGFVTIFRGIF